MKENVSFIGTGNMGGALIHAACRALDPKQVIITDSVAEKANSMAKELKCCCVKTNKEAVEKGNYIFLCVKPQIVHTVLNEIAPVLKDCLRKGEKKILVSIAAGVEIAAIKKMLVEAEELLKNDEEKWAVIRVMPNTSAAIGKGMLAVAAGPEVEEEYVNGVMEILSKAGRVERLSENLIDSFTALCGSSPAYVYMFIEALADGAVAAGLPRSQAQTYAAQTVMGAASMVLETGRHPGELKDAVCSPAGSTIAGVAKLEEKGFRSAVIEAVKAGYEKNKDLGK